MLSGPAPPVGGRSHRAFSAQPRQRQIVIRAPSL